MRNKLGEKAYWAVKTEKNKGISVDYTHVDQRYNIPLSAKRNYIQALYDYNTNKAKLEHAMGVPVK